MEIKLTKEEIDFIVARLGQCPANFVYEVLKLLDNKCTEASKAKEEVAEG